MAHRVVTACNAADADKTIIDLGIEVLSKLDTKGLVPVYIEQESDDEPIDVMVAFAALELAMLDDDDKTRQIQKLERVLVNELVETLQKVIDEKLDAKELRVTWPVKSIYMISEAKYPPKMGIRSYVNVK